MDPRIRDHARTITTHSASIAAGDDVVIDAGPEADDLVTALHSEIAEVGANPLTIRGRSGNRFRRAYLRTHDGEFDLPSHEMALFEELDVYIAVRSDRNVTETADVDPATTSAYAKARKPLLDERLSKRWCLTQYPTPAYAQLAGMSTEAYRDFVWDAINKDWDAVRDHQGQLVEILQDTDEIRIESGDTTDISLEIRDNPVVNDYGEKNLPGGEVFTAPIPDSVTGEVLFDKPLYHQSREIEDVYLRFEDGTVTEHSAGTNEDVLTEVLETDDGARRLGELGIGMNRDISRFTYNMLFDEKMGDTVHMAVGRAYGDTVAADNEQNQSAVHVDMIVDMSDHSRIEADGDVIQRDGRFVFEDGFEQ